MRLKIIAGNLLVVLAIGLISFIVVRSQVEQGLSDEIVAQISNDHVLFSRSWRLSSIEFLDNVRDRASTQDVRAALGAIDVESKRRRAFAAVESVSEWFRDPARGRGGAPDIVAITDETGKVVARSTDINRMFGQSLVQALPPLAQALRDGTPRHDVWLKTDENKLLQTGVAPIRSDQGAILGALIVGYDLSNGLAQAESRVLGRDVAFVVEGNVYSSSLPGTVVAPLKAHLFGPLQADTQAALNEGAASRPWSASLGTGDYVGVVSGLPMASATKVAFVVLENRSERLALVSATNVILILLVLGVIAVLVYGFIIGTSFLRPMEQIEEDVLAVINGRTDRRIDIKSSEFGGLAYRINQLINVFTGVAEEDDDGRVSHPGPPGGSWDASLGEGTPGQGAAAAAAAVAATGGGAASDVVDDPEVAAKLAAEPEDAYYTRIYQEYVAAKQAVGEDVSNIPQERFIQRLKGNESSLAQKHGSRAVRFLVQTRGNQVVLRPVLIR